MMTWTVNLRLHACINKLNKICLKKLDELDNDTEDFNPQESNKYDLVIQLDDVPTNSVFSKEPLGDNVKETLREMKEMMKALCEKFKKIEKCLKEIKDLQQRY